MKKVRLYFKYGYLFIGTTFGISVKTLNGSCQVYSVDKKHSCTFARAILLLLANNVCAGSLGFLDLNILFQGRTLVITNQYKVISESSWSSDIVNNIRTLLDRIKL